MWNTRIGKSFYFGYDGRSTLWSRVAPSLRLTSPTPYSSYRTPWDEILVDHQTKPNQRVCHCHQCLLIQNHSFIIQYIIKLYFCNAFCLLVWGASNHDKGLTWGFVNERIKGLNNVVSNGFLCHLVMASTQMGHDVMPWTQPKQRFVWPNGYSKRQEKT